MQRQLQRVTKELQLHCIFNVKSVIRNQKLQ